MRNYQLQQFYDEINIKVDINIKTNAEKLYDMLLSSSYDFNKFALPVARRVVDNITEDSDLDNIAQIIRNSFLNLDEYLEKHKDDDDPEAEALGSIYQEILKIM